MPHLYSSLTDSQIRIANIYKDAHNTQLGTQFSFLYLVFLSLHSLSVCSQSFGRITNTRLRFSQLCTRRAELVLVPHGTALFLFETIWCGQGSRGDGGWRRLHLFFFSWGSCVSVCVLSVHLSPSNASGCIHVVRRRRRLGLLSSFCRLPFWVASVQDTVSSLHMCVCSSKSLCVFFSNILHLQLMGGEKGVECTCVCTQDSLAHLARCIFFKHFEILFGHRYIFAQSYGR